MRRVSLERLPKRRFNGVPGAWELVVIITPRPSKRISTPRSIVLVDTIIPSLAGQHLCATIQRRRPANTVVVSSPMTGLDLTQFMFEASNLDESITRSHLNWGRADLGAYREVRLSDLGAPDSC